MRPNYRERRAMRQQQGPRTQQDAAAPGGQHQHMKILKYRRRPMPLNTFGLKWWHLALAGMVIYLLKEMLSR